MKFYSEAFMSILKASSWSVTGFSKEIGVTRRTVYNWFSGIQKPDEFKTRKIAKLLEVKVCDISDLAEIDRDSYLSSSENNLNIHIEDKDMINESQKFQSLLNGIRNYYENSLQINTVIKALIASVDIIIYVKDINNKYIIANRAFLENVGLKVEYITKGKTDFDFFNSKEEERMKLKRKIFVELMLSLAIIFGSSAMLSAQCVVSSTNTGWTGTIVLSSTKDVDLSQNAIQFDLSNNVKVSSIWGLDGQTEFSQNGNTVTINAYNWWPANSAYILSANKEITLNFSTSSDNYQISNVRITGSETSYGKVTFQQQSSSSTIPSDTKITLTSTTQGKNYTFNWNDAKTKEIEYGSYTVSASSSEGTIQVLPAEIQINSSNQNETINLSYTPAVKSSVYVKVSGLPTGQNTTLTFTSKTDSSKTYSFNNVTNGTNSSPYEIDSGEYTLNAKTITVDSNQYTISPLDITINSDSSNSFTLVFTKVTTSDIVSGWPNYIAMGAVTDSDYTNKNTFANRPVDAIFKYAGDGGNGDPGRIVYPVYTKNVEKQAQNLTEATGKKVMPVMVVYTAEMSGGTNYKDLKNSGDYENYLTKHFINLMLVAGTMESYKTTDTPYPGSIVLNPDLLGMVQQQKLWTTAGTGELNKMDIDVNAALKRAVWFMETPHNWTITRSWGNSIVIKNKTPLEVISNIADLKSQGVYSDWDIKYGWETAADQILANAPAVANIKLSTPTFTDNFQGWIQANNWAIKKFGPNITFGWQSNVWSGGSANWVHKTLTASQISSDYAAPVSELWNELKVYNGAYKPNFIVFDKYEMDAAAASGIGYLWNHRDLNNYLDFARDISQQIGNYPVMLWQIPGGHMQLTNDVDTRGNHGSTEPDYFFGDSNIQSGLTNVKSYFNNLQLSADSYNGFTGTAQKYLTQNGQNWTKSNMVKAKDSNVFSILWGGGQTTSVGTYPSNDGGWLANKIIEYYKNPTYLSSIKQSNYL